MRKFALVFALAAGCGSKTPDIVTTLEDFKDQICACKDADCAIAADKAGQAAIDVYLKKGDVGDLVKYKERIEKASHDANVCFEKTVGRLPDSSKGE